MEDNSQCKTEINFGYSLSDYERPSVTTDVAAFSLRTEKKEEYRLSPEPKLCVLLIRRGVEPFKDSWALPGGFMKKGETVEECAYRELEEETNLIPQAMLWVNTFSKPGRDPRGWVISNAFASISCEENAKIIGSSDAKDAKWFDVRLTEEEGVHLLELEYGEIFISAKLKKIKDRTGRVYFEITENNGISFDHASIIAEAMETLKREAENIETVFCFLPEKFTLTTLQRLQETLMGITHLTPNFRRKVSDLVEETDEYTEGAGHRPARLFKKKKI